MYLERKAKLTQAGLKTYLDKSHIVRSRENMQMRNTLSWKYERTSIKKSEPWNIKTVAFGEIDDSQAEH